MNNRQDILARGDVVRLIDTFYDAVRKDEVIGHIFNVVTSINWDTHMPTMYNFWSSLLLSEHTYSGNPMIKHIDLSKRTRMSKIEFDRWLSLFNATIDNLFAGPTANLAKAKAADIASLMQDRIGS